MNKLFSKSNESDLPIIHSNILLLLSEQRAQRNDLKLIRNALKTLINDVALQKQVDDYYGEKEPEEVPETL